MYQVHRKPIPAKKVPNAVEDKFPFALLAHPDDMFEVPLNNRPIKTVRGNVRSACKSLIRQGKLPADYRMLTPFLSAEESACGKPCIGIWRRIEPTEPESGVPDGNTHPEITLEPKRGTVESIPATSLRYDARANHYIGWGAVVSRRMAQSKYKYPSTLAQAVGGCTTRDMQAYLSDAQPIPGETMRLIMLKLGCRDLDHLQTGGEE